MRDIEGIEDVVKSLKPHWAAIDAYFAEENARYKGLMAGDHDALGRILKCHLIVENYLNRYLEAHYRLADVEDVRLSFYQKSKLLPDAATTAAFVKPGILELNAIRNQFSHQLNASIQNIAMHRINDVLAIARSGVAFVNNLERIEAFTTVACAFLIIPTPELQTVFMEAFKTVRVCSLDRSQEDEQATRTHTELGAKMGR